MRSAFFAKLASNFAHYYDAFLLLIYLERGRNKEREREREREGEREREQGRQQKHAFAGIFAQREA